LTILGALSQTVAQNDPKRLCKLKNKLPFYESIAAIAVADDIEADTARKAVISETRSLTPAAKEKLVVKSMHVPKLARKEISSLLVAYYGVSEKLYKKKK
jgi:hypothetical protein